MNKKSIIIIVTVLLLLIVGITYAYYTFEVNEEGEIEAEAMCFNIDYIKGQDIGSNEESKTLMVGSDYKSGLSTTVKMKIDANCNIPSANGHVYLTTEDTTDDILLTSNVLNYAVLNDTSVVKQGVITSKGTISIYDNFTVNTLEKSITVYVWLSGENITDENVVAIMQSNYQGHISTKAESR